MVCAMMLNGLVRVVCVAQPCSSHDYMPAGSAIAIAVVSAKVAIVTTTVISHLFVNVFIQKLLLIKDGHPGSLKLRLPTA